MIMFSPPLSHKRCVEDASNSDIIITQCEADDKEENTSDDSLEEFDPYYFIYTLPPHSTVRVHGKICLPPIKHHHKRTLVLDLDETLVHCSLERSLNPDFSFPVDFNLNKYEVFVRKRPYVDYFLEAVSAEFEVVVFTASQQIYADKLLDILDPQKKIFSSRLFRDSCLDVFGNFIKDLSVLNRDLSKVWSHNIEMSDI